MLIVALSIGMGIGMIDRRFNRSRHDVQSTVAAFTGRLRDAIDPGTIGKELLHVVDEAVAPAGSSPWINQR